MFRVFSLFDLAGVFRSGATTGGGGTTPTETIRYYVDATAGDDDNDGLTLATPWQTIAKVNASTFNPGEQILFKRGETWREQLTVPSSGAEGNPIVFGAYGSGTAPVISGADLLADWTDTLTANAGDTNTGGTTNISASHLYFFKITPSVSGTLTSYKFWIGAVGVGTINAALYTDAAGLPGIPISGSDADPVAISVNSWVALLPSATVEITAGTSYWIAAQSSGTYQASVAGGTGGGVRIATSNVFGTFPSSPAVIGAGTAGDFRKYLTIASTPIENVWSSAIATQPNNVFFDGALGLRGASLEDLSTPTEWFWTGGRLYAYSTGNPATTYPNQGVEVSSRTHCLLCPQNDVTIQDVRVYGASGLANIMVRDASDLALERVVVRRCESHHSYYHGIYFYGVSAGEISDNHVHDCWDGRAYLEAGVSTARGIQTYGANTSNIEICRNIVEDCYIGIWCCEGSKDIHIHHNIVLRSMVNGIDSYDNSVGANPVLVHHNTVHHRPRWTAGHGIDIQGASRGITIKNNIVYSDYDGVQTNVQLICLSASSYAEVISDYNVLHKAPGCTADVGKLRNGSLYATLGAWQAALASSSIAGGDVNSIDADPLFTDLDGGDFTLQSGSPCINAGTPIPGLTTDYAGNPIIGNPDIGALEYQS
jgi:hypothetical protein